MGLQTVYGDINLRFVSDIDKNASTLLAHHHPNVPNLGDLTIVEWADIEAVDVLCAGYPCQPFSYAGYRKGEQDERAIFEYIADAISVLRPRNVLLENVAGHLTLGAPTVIAILTKLGYNAKWGIVRASDTGAPHQRKRLFIWCETENTNSKRKRQTTTAQGRRRQIRPSRPVRETITDATSVGRQQRAGQFTVEGGRKKTVRSEGDRELSRSAKTITDTGSERYGQRQNNTTMANYDKQMAERSSRQQSQHRSTKTYRWRQYETAIRRWEAVMGRIAPSPVDDKGVNPVFVEWLMGLPEGHVTSLDISRAGQLKMLGNGVVPQQAALALHLLTEGY